jgi:hypothetical protein
MAWLTLAADLVKGIAWPVVVAIIAWRLGPKLGEVFTGRSVDFQGFGVKATIRALEQQQATTAENPATRADLAVSVAAPALPPRAAREAIEQRIRVQLDQYPQQNREAILIGALAQSRLVGQHEFVYNRIFGSQMAGLKRLDEIGSATVAQAQEFFEPFAKQFPDVYANYGFDRWLGFMVTSGLVARDGDTLTATQFGHDFLVYLREARLTEAKLG